MLPQPVDDEPRKAYHASRSARFRVLARAAIGTLYRATIGKLSTLQVNVAPTKRQQFAAPQAGAETRHDLGSNQTCIACLHQLGDLDAVLGFLEVANELFDQRLGAQRLATSRSANDGRLTTSAR